jgi:hypothetical protein
MQSCTVNRFEFTWNLYVDVARSITIQRINMIDAVLKSNTWKSMKEKENLTHTLTSMNQSANLHDIDIIFLC